MKKKSSIFIYTVIMGLLVLLNSCKEEDIPVLTTNAVTGITQTTATSGGNITSDGGTTVTARGVCWSTGQTPTISDNKTTDGTGAGNFISNITGLVTGTTYYVRAYATYTKGTAYGSALSFTTQGGTTGTITDIDGNVYHAVTIGTQVWMVENLKTTKYRDGTSIPNITDDTSWENLSSGAYCDYNNTPSNSDTYGRLYNWHAATDEHNIAPTGWHVPSDAEWKTLMTYLGGEDVAGGKLKEKGTTHWNSPNEGATNETGFTGLPGGNRYHNGPFSNIGYFGMWWNATEEDATKAWYHQVYYNFSFLLRLDRIKESGYSVRCVKD